MSRRHRKAREQRPAGVRAKGPPTTVRCQGCNTRLGSIWPERRGWSGSFPPRSGRPVIVDAEHADDVDNEVASEDWNSITCPRCSRNWQGRDTYLHDLAAIGGEVRLGQLVPRSSDPVAEFLRSEGHRI